MRVFSRQVTVGDCVCWPALPRALLTNSPYPSAFLSRSRLLMQSVWLFDDGYKNYGVAFWACNVTTSPATVTSATPWRRLPWVATEGQSSCFPLGLLVFYPPGFVGWLLCSLSSFVRSFVRLAVCPAASCFLLLATRARLFSTVLAISGRRGS